MDFRKVETVGIVGAGVAGLATARSLMSIGKRCTLFERSSRPGGVWSDGYVNFGVQVQRELYEFPDWPLPADTPDFAPGPIIEKYLCDFSDHFNITPHIRFNSTVTGVRENDKSDSTWLINILTGETRQNHEFDLIVICIGLYSNIPNLAEFPNRNDFLGEVIHNSSLKTSDQLANKRVAVIGYGKSATDAALEAANVASETHIIFRTPHWPIPQKLATILPFKWGLLHRLNSTLIPPYQHTTTVEKIVHGMGKPLVWFYWRLVETLIRFQCKLGSRFKTRVNLVPDKPVEIDAFGESTMIPRGDFYKRARNGEINLHHSEIDQYVTSGLKLANGEALDVDLVVMATGWKTDFSFIDSRVWQRLEPSDDGFYLYRHILHPDTPGLVFIGRASSISSILTYCLQAHWLKQVLIGNVMLPDESVLKTNIIEMRKWKRAWIPFSSSRSARLIAHTQHYHDELLKDFNADPLRKTGLFAPVKELIFPYEPSDYSDLFKE